MGELEEPGERPNPADLIPFLAPLQALQDLLSEFNDQGLIIGGIAASLLGAPRYTADLDAVLLLNVSDIPRLIQVASSLSIEPRISDAAAFARKNRVLLLRHIPSGIDIDISIGMLPFEYEMVERSVMVEIAHTRLRLPTPEDLIILKAVAHRPKDLIDIQAIAANYPHLDVNRIQAWVDQFGEALDTPDLWKMIAPLLLSES